MPKHEELLKISNNPKVYISRRSLKHFVESRSKEMKGKDSPYAIKKLYFAVEHVEICIQKGVLDEGYNTYIYAHYFEELKSDLRIVIEHRKNIQQIKSIHFQRNKKATD